MHKVIKNRILAVFIATSLIFSWSVWAQDEGGFESLSLNDLLNLVISTGSFLDLDISKSPLSMSLIQKDQVQISGARHLTELLEIYVPGFQYNYNIWNGTQWGMRGVSNDRNTKFLVLINGHKINSESKDGFIAETELGLLGDVERVEVLRGPAGLVYGSGAIAGIVNIVTRTDMTDKTELSVTLATEGQSFKQTAKVYDLRSYYTPEEDHRIAFSLGWKESDGMGDGFTRQYAKDIWPFCTWCGDARKDWMNGTPSDGSFGKINGNWRASADYQWKDLRVYGRMTHQEVTNAFFPFDPWPNKDMGYPDEKNITVGDDSYHFDDPNVFGTKIEGKDVNPGDDFWAQTESWGNQRNNYVADNITLGATWETSIGGENKLKLEAAFDGVTNRSVKDQRTGYLLAETKERGDAAINQTIGERRYTLGAMTLWKDLLPATQLAVGAQQRFDDLGKDLTGKNFGWGDPDHPAIAEKLYSNTAVFTEGMSDFSERLSFGYGLRWDGHTRTIQFGGTLNGKLAVVFTPIENHTIKLIAQSSSNNGTIDNYEYNANFYDDDGKFVKGDPEFKDPANPTDDPDDILNLKDGKYVVYLTEKDLHDLRPERVYSYEITSSHNFNNTVFLSPSVSYNIVQDLFAWAQELYQVINAGEYHHLDADFDIRMDTKYLNVGFNHAVQVPVRTKLKDLGYDAEVGIIDYEKDGWKEVYGKDKNGNDLYRPVANKDTTITINPAGSMLIETSKDAGIFNLRTHFRALHQNVSKLYVDVKPLPWLTLHSDWRIFWGLVGRTEQYANLAKCGEADGCDGVDSKLGYQTWDVANQSMVKWNASAHFSLPEDIRMSFFVYNVLGTDNPYSKDDDRWTIHSLRWGNGDENALFGVDLRSYAFRIEKSF